MSIVLALRDYLGTLDPLTALVGQRIFPLIAPQENGECPRVRYVRTSDQRERNVERHDRTRSGTAKFCLFIEAATYESCAAIEEAIRGDPSGGTIALDGLTGEVIGPASGQQYQVRAMIDDARDDGEQPVHGDDAWIYRTELDVTILYQSVE